MTLLIPRPQPEAAARFWSTWVKFFDHVAGCLPCRSDTPCAEGVRLEEIHTAARKQLHADAASMNPPCR